RCAIGTGGRGGGGRPSRDALGAGRRTDKCANSCERNRSRRRGCAPVGGTMVLATGVAGEVASYVVLFVLVFLGGAGVPVIGTAAVTASRVLPSHGTRSVPA